MVQAEQEVAVGVPQHHTPAGHERRVSISAAQLRVLSLLADGSTYETIARRLYLSPTTVRTHVLSLQKKLGAPNNVALVLAAVVVGLLTHDSWPIELTGATDFDPRMLIQPRH